MGWINTCAVSRFIGIGGPRDVGAEEMRGFAWDACKDSGEGDALDGVFFSHLQGV